MQKQITKAKVKEGSVEATFTFHIDAGTELIRGDGTQVCNWPPHPELKAAMQRLVPHLIVLCEQMEHPIEIGDFSERQLEPYTVTGFSIGGSDEHEGVTLVGQRRLQGNRVLNLVAPFTKWESEHEPYYFADDLSDAVMKASFEIKLALEGKRSDPIQGSLDFTDPEQAKPNLN